MERDEWALLRKFLVWFQAEQTIPNALVLASTQVPLDGAMRVRLADQTGWPGDPLTWARVILWLISLIERLPVRLLPLAFEVFRVWQNQFTCSPNPISETILTICAQWLEDIERVTYREGFSVDPGRWNALQGETLKSFETHLRQTILLTMRTHPDAGKAVLDRAITNDELRGDAYEHIVELAPTIAANSPQKLADLARAELLEKLPKDAIEEEEEGQRRSLEHLARIRAKPEEERTEAEKRALSAISMSAFGSRRELGLDKLAIDKHNRVYFPTSPLQEPFASLFRENANIGRALVRDMGNHATTAWRQIHELRPRHYGTPIPLDLDFPWGRQRFWGDGSSYNWTNDHPAPHPLTCAFMALAYWAHKELEKGVQADDLIRQVVEGHESWGVLALAGALALERSHASATVFPIATAQRLWKMDMARVVHEPMRGIDLLGIGELIRLTGDKEVAMNYLKSRTSRHRNIRDLTPLFALSPDDELRAAFQDRLAHFSRDLPYDYEEQRGNSSLETDLREEAEQWAGLGDASNYRASSTPDGERVVIEYNSPTPLSEATRESSEEAGVSLDEFRIHAWATKSLNARAVDPSSTLEDALACVKTRYTSTLFDHLTPAGGGMTQSAVSGVAACVLVVGTPSAEDREWAVDVMRRVETMQEERDHIGGGNIPWHPAFHLSATLQADLQEPGAQDNAGKRLFGLCIHPNTNVGRTALAILLNSSNQAIAWNATVLATDLWHRREPSLRPDGKRNYSAQQRAESTAVSQAITKLFGGTSGVPAPLPAPWPPRRRGGDTIFDEDDVGSEQEAIVSFDYRAAEEIVQSLPVETFCESETYKEPFLAYVRRLVEWTARRFAPQDDNPDLGRSRRRERAMLNLWPARLGEVLARVVPYVQVEDMRTNYLGPFLTPDDENALEVSSHFVESLVCRHVLDAGVVAPNTIALLHVCTDQVLANPTFRRRNYRAGEVRGGDLPRTIKGLLFVPLNEPHARAIRFANDNWSDLPAVLPLVDRLVGECGWTPYVMNTFLTMAERAGSSYPIDAFVTLMTRVLTELNSEANSWIGTMISARIAGVIQTLADGNYPLSAARATPLLRLLDILIDLGDRRAAALEESETFRATQTQSQ